MADFNFTCPRCDYYGKNDELECYNCGNSIELIVETDFDDDGDMFSTQEIQCTICGISQVVNCPKCGTEVTDKLIEIERTKLSEIMESVGLAFAWMLFFGVIYVFIQFILWLFSVFN